MSTIEFADAPEEAEADVVVVGAGISGLYCAWRLNEQDPTRRIVVVERLDRTGGRLDTDLIEIRPGDVVREEEGGMRFNYEMIELMRLVSAMGLCDQIVPFPMASSIGGANTNRFFLRGRGFTAAEAADGDNTIWGELYDLSDGELGKSPGDIVTDAYHAVLKANGEPVPTEQPPEYWTRFRNEFCWDGTLMRDWQLWGLLRVMGHSEECVQMLSETIGFAGPFKAPINAGDAFQILADFPKDPHYYTFERGFSTLPNAVRDALPDDLPIWLSSNVDRIERYGDGFRLTVTQAPDRNATPWISGGVTKTISGKQLILAVATSGLESLFESSPALHRDDSSHRLHEAIGAARGMTLMKINLYFPEPWWLDGAIEPPVEFGPNFTSLPVNAVYPFYSLPDPDQHELTEQEQEHLGAAALTIYCDHDNTVFWQGLQHVGPLFTSPLQEFQSRPPQTLFAASQAVVTEARRQLGLLFGLDDVPEPILTSYRRWDGTDDFEHAYHQWRPGVADDEVRAYLANPLPGVYVCNEAISDMQGWVNGSLRSADAALAGFGLAPMDGPLCLAPAATTGDDASPRLGLWGA